MVRDRPRGPADSEPEADVVTDMPRADYQQVRTRLIIVTAFMVRDLPRGPADSEPEADVVDRHAKSGL